MQCKGWSALRADPGASSHAAQLLKDQGSSCAPGGEHGPRGKVKMFPGASSPRADRVITGGHRSTFRGNRDRRARGQAYVESDLSLLITISVTRVPRAAGLRGPQRHAPQEEVPALQSSRFR